MSLEFRSCYTNEILGQVKCPVYRGVLKVTVGNRKGYIEDAVGGELRLVQWLPGNQRC